MSAFDLFPSEQATKIEGGKPVDLSDGAGFFEGALTAPFKGAAKGLVVEPTRVLNLGLSAIPSAIDAAFGTSTRDWWFENTTMERTSKRFTPNPRETGIAGQMLHALFDIGSQAVVGGPGAVLVSKTVGGSMEGIEQGLDTLTAMKKGALEGGAAAAGVALPIAIPPVAGSRIPALVQQLGYGVGTNVPMGVAQRGLTYQVLADAGYRDMAEQYKALDEGALLTDLVLGVAFGGLGHVLQAKGAKLGALNASDVDAALTKRNAYHIEVDTAPGLARDGQTRDAHVESVMKATQDLIEGRPVDVSEMLRATNFEPNPGVDAQRTELARATGEVIAPIRKALTEAEAAHQSPDYVESRRQLAQIEHQVTQLEDQARTAYDAGKHDEVTRLRAEVDTLKAERDRLDQQAHANLQSLVEGENKGTLGGKPEALGAPVEHPPEKIHAALKAEGLDTSEENVAKVKLIARARALDAAAVDALPERMPDGEYMARIKEIANAEQSAQAPGAGSAKAGDAGSRAKAGEPGGQGTEAAGGKPGEARPSGEGTGHIDDAEVRAAESIAQQYPEMFVTLEDGSTVSAHAAMQQANEVIAQAQLEAKAFEAAVLCATRVGG